MQIISKFWNNFKIQPDIWFFYGFLITFTLSIRKVLYFFPVKDQFNEYAGVFVYLSDIFLIAAIVIWLITILYNKRYTLSIDKLKKVYILAPLLLVIWAFISIIWAENYYIALFRSIKILEFFLLYIYIVFRLTKCSTPAPCLENVPRGTFSKFTGWNIFMKIIISVAVVQSVLAIFQFILQHSIGLFWLKESLIGPDILGVAKIIVNGDKIIRSYGLFPHPNILGGFLLFSIIITILYQRVFHLSTNVPRGTLYGASVEQFHRIFNIKCSTCLPSRQAWNILILCLECFALFLTFSKSAIIGLGLALSYVCFINVPPQYKCSTWNIIRGRRGTFISYFKKQFKWLALGFLVMIIFLFAVKFDLNSLFVKSLGERSLYINVSRGTILHNPVVASGIGQFVFGMQNYSKQVLDFWQFQPVHNVFLLIWSELGVIGLILFLVFLFKLLWNKENVPRGTFSNGVYFKAILLGLIFIMLFDHYLWDIQQGQILLWMVLGLVVGSRINIDKE